jgi:hypothetical protein
VVLACRVTGGLIGAGVLVLTVGALAAERTVEFEADRVEMDPDGNLDLEGNVAVTSGRYRLTGDHVEVRRTPRGVWVDGQGRVALCPCPDPPVTLAFRRALVAPPTDLVLTEPTVRVGSVPVAWLPYLWLRSPERWGVLPPKLAWRANDGLLAGTGVHAPLGAGGSADLRAAGYLAGGVELEARIQDARSTTTVRWDHLRESLLAVDSRGFTSEAEGSGVAWDLDAIRGRRAAGGPVLLEAIARRYDRARAGATWAHGGAALGISALAGAERGGELRGMGAVGPGLHASFGAPVDGLGVGHVAIATQTLDNAEGSALSFLQQNARIEATARPGAVSVGASMHGASAVLVEEAAAQGAAAAGAVATVALPLERTYSSDVRHVVAPFVEAGGKLSRADVSTMPWVHGSSGALHAALGLRSTVGRYASRTGASAVLRAGTVGAPEAQRRLLAARAVADIDLLGAGAEAVWEPERTDAGVVLGSVRAGRADGVHLVARAAGSAGEPVLEGRTLVAGGWHAVPVDWLDRPGWAFGSSVGIPWARWLASGFDVDYDWTQRALLGVRGATAYHHPCRCLALTAWAGHRAGRDGIDAMLTIDLAP